MLKIKDNVDLKELEKFGWETFYVPKDNAEYLYAVKDIYVASGLKTNWYRVGVSEDNRKFRKSKFRPGKCLLSVKVTKKDIEELVKADMVEKVEE